MSGRIGPTSCGPPPRSASSAAASSAGCSSRPRSGWAIARACSARRATAPPRRWPTGRSSARPTTSRPCARSPSGPRPSPSSSRTSRPRPSAGSPGAGRSGPAGGPSGSSQNRLREKTFLARHGIPHAPWRPVRSADELAAAVDALGLPLILKTAASGYDGKGQVRVERADEAAAAWASLRPGRLRGRGVGRVRRRGLGRRGPRRRRRRGRLPGRPEPARAAHPRLDHHARADRPDRHARRRTAWPWPSPGAGDGRRPDRRVLPDRRGASPGQRARPAAAQLGPPDDRGRRVEPVRAAGPRPLRPPARRHAPDLPAAMVNLLGDLWSDGPPDWDAALRADPGIKLHLYGKRTPAPGRKMGHLTVLDPDPAIALTRALAARHGPARPTGRRGERTWSRRQACDWRSRVGCSSWRWSRSPGSGRGPGRGSDGRRSPASRTDGGRDSAWLSPLPIVLRSLAMCLMVVAMARPQVVGGRTRVAGRGWRSSRRSTRARA